MRVKALLVAIGLLGGGGQALAQTKALFISGVASGGDRAREDGHSIGLYATKDQGGRLTGDRTNKEGVFSLYLANVDREVRELWVLNEDAAFGASPVRVDALSETSPEIIKAGVLALHSSQRPQYSAAEARALCRTWVETQAAKVRLGLTSDQQATEALDLKAAGLAVKVVNLGMSGRQLLIVSIDDVREPALKAAVSRFRAALADRERARTESDATRP